MKRSAALVCIAIASLQSLTVRAVASEALYRERCAMCHGADGGGVPGIYPRLRDRVASVAATPAGADYLIQAVLYGMSGPIEVDGIPIDGIMPGFASLSDQDVASILNYVGTGLRTPVNDPTPVVSAAGVERLRARTLTPSEVHRERAHAIDLMSKVTQPANLAKTVRLAGPQEDYVRACQGCHREDGCTDPAITPPLRNSVGYFTHSAEGRAFLVQVPGVASSALDDAGVARVLNWILFTLSPQQVVTGFVPYEAEEVGRLRKQVLVEVSQRRARLLDELGMPQGVIPASGCATGSGLAAVTARSSHN